MSDYVPTTEEVRSDYGETYEGTNEKRYARFDRWLAAHDAEVAAKAWDEGFCSMRGENPYRKAVE